MRFFRGKIRRLAAPKEPQPGEEAGELNVVPFLDILTNVMVFVLASLAAAFTVSVVVEAPHRPGIGPGKTEPLTLTVLVGVDGYYVKGSAAGVGPGCSGIGAGVTVPRIAAGTSESTDGLKFDALALKRCARRLKDQVPGADLEKQVILTASPNVPFEEVVRAMDALRGDEKGTLFPDVIIAAR